MGQADYFAEGDWNADCALCGSKRKASTMKKIPDGVPGAGLYMCADHNYKRNPQDFVRGIPDRMAPPWTQQTAELGAIFCTPNGTTAYPDFAIPDCVMPDYISFAFDPAVTV